MAVDPARPVIGVFGSGTKSDDERDAVERISQAINRAGAIVLSGAEPPSNGYPVRPKPVKDLAVYALRGVPDWPSVLWVGVANHDDSDKPVPHGTRGLVVTPGWAHRRNFVEAAMCDAAFAVEATTEGTASEALYCLYFGRPLSLVVGGPAGSRVTPRELRNRIGTRVKPKGDKWAVDVGITQALIWAGSSSERVRTRPLPADDASAEGLVAKLLAGVAKLHRPAADRAPGRPFEHLAHNDGWDSYVRGALDDAGRWP